MELPSIEDFYNELGEKIKVERLRQRISQEELAEYLNLTRSSIINLEKGRHRPSVYQILQIAAMLNIEYIKLIPVTLKVDKNTTTNEQLKEKVQSELDPNEFDHKDKNAVLDFLSLLNK
ncbi:helix-turn-helix transcriptional regulator [Mucilaginibacter defluvii]|uniref:HTH cro/C1-type domain-containing protein n=1 Tax=Mucilaginibacter defluvii TaxID=1196019 RepID=A0ABP9G726_9SPHI